MGLWWTAFLGTIFERSGNSCCKYVQSEDACTLHSWSSNCLTLAVAASLFSRFTLPNVNGTARARSSVQPMRGHFTCTSN
ncbi:hypothetical protein V8E53_006816 [Lactarius tabidus]